MQASWAQIYVYVRRSCAVWQGSRMNDGERSLRYIVGAGLSRKRCVIVTDWMIGEDRVSAVNGNDGGDGALGGDGHARFQKAG